MLHSNEFGEIDPPIIHSKFDNIPTGYRIAELMIADTMEILDIQPPTSESLTASVKKGIEVGRELNRLGFGETVVTQTLCRLIREYFYEWPTNDNALSFQIAAEEAFLASDFRFVSADFEHPIDVAMGVRSYNPPIKY
jgi:hypothetical protein